MARDQTVLLVAISAFASIVASGGVRYGGAIQVLLIYVLSLLLGHLVDQGVG